MKARLKELFASPMGKVLLLLLALLITGVVMWLIHDNRMEARQVVKQAEPVKLVVDTSKNLFGPSAPKPEPTQRPARQPQTMRQTSPQPSNSTLARPYREPSVVRPVIEQRSNDKVLPKVNPEPPSLSLYTAKNRKRKPVGAYAAYGRMVKCELINTIATSNLYTPVIGLVTEGLWWNDEQIIPAGVEVHGVAAASPVRNRIGAATRWVVVWPHRRPDWNGKEMILDAVPLCYDRTANGWSKDDGSAGIKGKIISNKDQQQMFAFIASFISGLGEGLVSQSNTYTGGSTISTTGGTWKDALGSALKDSFKTVCDQVLKDLAQNMTYVEAEAGTEFYLYVRQVIDVDDADVANTNIVNPVGQKAEVRKGR